MYWNYIKIQKATLIELNFLHQIYFFPEYFFYFCLLKRQVRYFFLKKKDDSKRENILFQVRME